MNITTNTLDTLKAAHPSLENLDLTRVRLCYEWIDAQATTSEYGHSDNYANKHHVERWAQLHKHQPEPHPTGRNAFGGFRIAAR